LVEKSIFGISVCLNSCPIRVPSQLMNCLKLFVILSILLLSISQNCFPIENNFLLHRSSINVTETEFILAGRTSAWIGISFSTSSLMKDSLITLIFEPPNVGYELVNHSTLINSTKLRNVNFENDIRLNWNRIFKVSFTLPSETIQNFTHIIVAENPEGRLDVTHSHVTFRSFDMNIPSIFFVKLNVSFL
jgi:hypothetical protein